MSEPRDTVNVETNEVVDDQVEQEDVETSEADEDADAGGDEAASRPAVDWEKRAHDKEGQAARERSRRRAAERQVQELNARLERLETQVTKSAPSKRQQLINRLRADTDEPLSDLEDLKEIARTLLEDDAQEAEATQQQQRQVQRVNALTTAMTEYEADFRSDHKDYDQACEFFKKSRAEELEDMGYVGQRLTQRLSQEMFALVDDAIQAGRDPAEMVYGMAKRRGFAGTADDATRKLQKLQQGAKSATTARPGANGQGRVTYDQVTRAKGAVRDKLWAQLRKQEMGIK